MSRLAEVDGGHYEYSTSLWPPFQKSIDEYPDDLALIVTHQSADHLASLATSATSIETDGPLELNDNSPRHLEWTYRQMYNGALKIVALMQRAGLKQGSHIAILTPNGIEWAVHLWAALLGKFAYTTLDVDTLSDARLPELSSMLRDVQPDAIVVVDRSAITFVDQALHTIDKQPLIKIIAEHDSCNALALGWQSLLSVTRDPVDPLIEARIARDTLLDDLSRIHTLSFTSGTTSGQPKGCPRTILSLVHVANWRVYDRAPGPQSRCLVTFSNFRGLLAHIALDIWRAGSTIVMPGQKFAPGPFIDAIASLRATQLFLVPAMYHAMVAHPNFKDLDVSRIASVGTGGDMITRDMFQKLEAAFPNANVFIVYGQTEGGAAQVWPFMNQSGSQLDKIPWWTGISPIGKVNRGARFRVVDENNNILKRNEVGEIHASSNSYITHYLHNIKPEEFYEDATGSWFKTGDTGFINDDDWIYVTGRKKDIVKRAGVTIQPAALENAIDTYVKCQSSVLGAKHEVLGQVPFAVVSSLGEVSKEAIEEHIVKLFGPESALGGIATLEELGLSKFPLNQTGKIMKLELMDPVEHYRQIFKA